MIVSYLLKSISYDCINEKQKQLDALKQELDYYRKIINEVSNKFANFLQSLFAI